MTDRTLLLGHSPDPDDAFMFYALATGKIDTRGWHFEHVLEDIQTLNDRAQKGELHITAVSIHAYPAIADRYLLTACGASMGDGYGPMVVAREPISVDDLRGRRIAVPGETTSAFLALNLLLGRNAFEHEVIMFDQILPHLEAGKAGAGLIIHEGQLTYGNHGLSCVIDLGRWWKDKSNLPLPLGGNCIRRDLGQAAIREITGILKQSIQYSLDHRAEAVQHALQYARDMGTDLADRFVGMYVNDWTLDFGSQGRRAIKLFLDKGAEIGMVRPMDRIEFVDETGTTTVP